MNGTHNADLNDPSSLTLKLNFEACPSVSGIKVEFRSSVSPFNLIESDSSSGGGNDSSLFIFENGVNGVPYYIVIKGVNSIETWSATPITFSSNTASYDFTTAISKAFGNNQKLSGGIPSFFQGDANQDGFVNTSDVLITYNNSSAFLTSPSTDFNCDGTTDLTDVSLAYNNATNFVQKKRP